MFKSYRSRIALVLGVIIAVACSALWAIHGWKSALGLLGVYAVFGLFMWPFSYVVKWVGKGESK